MSVNTTQTLDYAADFRPLTDAELDEVNGGFIALLAVFLYGLIVGGAVGITVRYYAR
jgi:lactobin A/cerein 7B family class IIb bacteriocin